MKLKLDAVSGSIGNRRKRADDLDDFLESLMVVGEMNKCGTRFIRNSWPL